MLLAKTHSRKETYKDLEKSPCLKLFERISNKGFTRSLFAYSFGKVSKKRKSKLTRPAAFRFAQNDKKYSKQQNSVILSEAKYLKKAFRFA